MCSFLKQNQLTGVQIWRDPGRSFQIVDDVISQTSGSITALDIVPLLHSLRVIKSKSEQELMRRSCSIIASATIETMKVCPRKQFSPKLLLRNLFIFLI